MNVILLLISSLFLITCHKHRLRSLETINLAQKVEDDVIKYYPKNMEIQTKNLCFNFVTILQVFGKEAMTESKSCNPSRKYLGLPILQKEQKPTCLDQLDKAFCDFEYNQDPSQVISEDLRNQLLVTLKGCHDKIEGYKCPSYDLKTQQITDSFQFCRGVEYNQNYQNPYNGRSDEVLDLNNQNYNMYFFVNNKDQKNCRVLTKSFNLCIKVIDLVLKNFKSTAICYKGNFGLYSGGLIRIYNQNIKQKCRNFVLPYFADISNKIDMTDPKNAQLCNNMYNEIKRAYDERSKEISKQGEQFKVKAKEQKEILEWIGQSQLQNQIMIRVVNNYNRVWTSCYTAMSNYLSLKQPARQQIQNNYLILKKSLKQLVSESKQMYDTSQQPYFTKSLLKQSENIIQINFKQINSSLSSIEGICSALQTFMTDHTKEIQLKRSTASAANSTSQSKSETWYMQQDEVDELSNKYVDIKTNYEQFLTSIEKKLLRELEPNQKLLQDSIKDRAGLDVQEKLMIKQKLLVSNYID